MKIIDRIAFALFITFICMLGSCQVVHAADKCQDPGLKPNLKKACYEFEKVCSEVGCSVSVK